MRKQQVFETVNFPFELDFQRLEQQHIKDNKSINMISKDWDNCLSQMSLKQKKQPKVKNMINLPSISGEQLNLTLTTSKITINKDSRYKSKYLSLSS